MYNKTASTELCHAIAKNADYRALSNTQKRQDMIEFATLL